MKKPQVWVSALIALALLLAVVGTAEAKLRDDRDRKIGEGESAFASGLQYSQSQLYDQAIAQFETAIAAFEEAERIDARIPRRLQLPMNPKHALAMMNMGVCNIQKGKDFHPRARDQIERAARQPEGRNSPLIWYNVTVVRTLMGNYVEALDALDRALALGFNNYDALRTDEDLYELRRKPGWRETLERHNVFL